MNNTLYVVVPYFNFVNYKRGQKNLDSFLATLQHAPGISVVLVEGYREERLPSYSGRVANHVQVYVPDVLWVKENLINIGFSYLPDDWQYGGWFDRDIMFLNPNWLPETIAALEVSDIVQPWSQCLYLNSRHEHAPLVVRDNSYTYAESLTGLLLRREVDAQNLYKGKHTQPGQAWTINRKYYDYLGGLYDKAILGGADSLWSIGLLGIKKFCVLEGIEEDAQEYLAKVSTAVVGATRGAIVHYYHGEIKNRQYVSRHDILKKHGFNPKDFLTYTQEGVLRYTEVGKNMETDVINYFLGRQEDL
jgi:hypothetical protein